MANSYQFFEDLQGFNLNAENYIVSFDITSLYTNVPIRETIDILTNLIYDDDNGSFRGMTRNIFRKLLELVTKDTYFIFNDMYYKQIDGLAMGSPLSATLANIFLCFHEVKWLEECPVEYKPLYYKIYVDDTFVIFRTREEAQQFLDYLNSRHDKISFTMETEQNNQIPFLDVLIKKPNNKFDISIYRKPTYTGLGVNFISRCYENFKLNTFNTLFYRAYKLTSSFANFHKEIEFLEKFFSENGFIPHLFYSKLRKFLNKTFCPPAKTFGPKKWICISNFHIQMTKQTNS